jgi:hypothetical protein
MIERSGGVWDSSCRCFDFHRRLWVATTRAPRRLERRLQARLDCLPHEITLADDFIRSRSRNPSTPDQSNRVFAQDYVITDAVEFGP